MESDLGSIAAGLGYLDIIRAWKELDNALWELVSDLARDTPLPVSNPHQARGSVAGLAVLSAIVETSNSIGGLLTVAGLNPTGDLFGGTPDTIKSALTAIRALEGNPELHLFPDFDSWAGDQRGRINVIITEDARAHEQITKGH